MGSVRPSKRTGATPGTAPRASSKGIEHQELMLHFAYRALGV